MRGGKHRQSLVDDASLRGKMDPRDVSDLLAYVREWCLRDGGRAGAPRGEGDDRAPGGKDASANGDGGDGGGGGGSTKHAERALAVAGPSFEDMNASGAMRASSPCLTAGFPSSPQMPPSSYPATLEVSSGLFGDGIFPPPTFFLFIARNLHRIYCVGCWRSKLYYFVLFFHFSNSSSNGTFFPLGN